jgi:dTDP-D-glucose 4,6-dehydratase
MTRQPFTSNAESEQGLPEIDLKQYDHVFENADKSFTDKSQEVINYFIESNVLAISNVKVQHAS